MDRRERLLFDPPEGGCVLAITGLPGGGRSAFDRSVYGNVGTITGATWVRLPSGLWCLSYDGNDDYVTLGNPAAFDFGSSDFSISLWFRTAVGSAQKLLDKQQDGSPFHGYSVQITSGGLIRAIIKDATGNTIIATSSGAYSDDAWHHVVLVRSVATGTLYIDAKADGTDTDASVGSCDNPDPLRLSYNRPSDPQYFTGYLALIRMYNRALSILELQSVFRQERDLFAVW